MFFTGPGLHIAGIAQRAAVLTILTAHSVGKLAAGPAPSKAGTAGLSIRAPGVLVTIHRARGHKLGGRLLGQPGHYMVLLLTALWVTDVAFGAAVLVVRAAHGLWGRAAAPLPRLQEAAGGPGGAAGGVVTGDIVPSSKGSAALQQWRAEGPLFTLARLCVTGVAMGAAVDVVIAAHGLRKRATPPASGLQAAAGVAIWAAHLSITLHLLHCFCRQLGKEGSGTSCFEEAFTLLQVAYGGLGAAVQLVLATDRIWQWAATI